MAAKLDTIKGLVEDAKDDFSNHTNPNKPYIEIRPFLIDPTVLYLGKNIALRLTDKNDKVISTYRIENDGIKESTSKVFEFDQYKIWVTEIKKDGATQLSSDDVSSLQTLFNDLNNDHKQELVNAILYSSIKCETEINFVEYNIENNRNQTDIDNIKEELRKIISNVIRVFENNRTIRINTIEIPNVFHVIRFASNLRNGFKKYSAQILLSDNQRKKISKFLNNKGNTTSVNALEDPLDGNSKSVADDCFKYECVRFQDYIEDTSGYSSESDKTRHEIENLIYGEISSNDKTVFYVPIHLNGAPWMAVYRIVPKENNIDYISFYRNKISKIAVQIRNEAYKTYFNLIRNKIETIGNQNSISLVSKIEYINEYLKLLSAYFAFYIPIFPEPLDSEDDFYTYLSRIVGSGYTFSFFMNLIWKNEIDYDNMQPSDFQASLKNELHGIYLKIGFEREKEKRRDLVSSATHSLKTELETTLIPLKNYLMGLPSRYSFTDYEKLRLNSLDYYVEEFYTLTSLSNLIDKIGDERKMVDSGKKDKLFVTQKVTLNVSTYLGEYKFHNPNSKIYIPPQTNLDLEINIYGIWLGMELLHTYLNMIFQNADTHGVEEKNIVLLGVSRENNELEFCNKTYYEKSEINPNKLTGNLYLFSELINKSKKMKMVIESGNYQFKIKLSWAK